MGTILSSRVKDKGEVVIEVAIDYEEAKQLKGHMDSIHVFSENVADLTANISQRGRNESTKYFLIPKEVREGMDFSAKTMCQRLDTQTKTIFVFVVDKLGA